MPTLRAYQSRAVEWIRTRQRGFIVAPAGSGKTIMAAASAAARFPFGANIVWLANTREQVEQATAAAQMFNLEIQAHCVAARPDCSTADLVIVDEAHHMPAATWHATIAKATGLVWGFSATPWSGDFDRDQVLRHAFQDFLVIDREEVLAGGSITRGVVRILDVDEPGEFDRSIATQTALETERRCRKFRHIPREEHERRARWQVTAQIVRENHERNRAIVNRARLAECSVLILVSTVEHGEHLAGQIPDSIVVHAKLPKQQRKAAIDAFRSGALKVMIATSLADEGLDVPRASWLILAAGGRSASKLEQRTGRVMRPHESKTIGTVYDFADRGSSMAHAQFRSRLKTYRKLGYIIEQ